MSEPPTTFRHSLSVLRSGIFARYMVAEFISMVGSWMQTQAQQFVVEDKAATPLDQALISFALLIVIPLFGPWAGSVADRLDRRRILITVIAIQALLAAAVGLLLHAQWLQLWQLTVVAVILGITHAFESPAYSALLPSMVPREKLGAAVAMDRSIFHAGRIIGPALAGFCLTFQNGLSLAFFANAVSFLGPIAILLTLPKPPPESVAESLERRSGFAAGWRFVVNDPPTSRMILLMAAGAWFCSPFVMILLTFYARRTVGLEQSTVGWIMSLTGIGALISFVLLLAIPRERRIHFLRLGAVVSVVAMLGLAIANHFAVVATGFALLTLGLNFIFGIGNQLIQERASDTLRGRISTVASLSFVAVIPFSGIFAALLDRWIGMRGAFVACAIGYAVVAGFLLTFRWPHSVRKHGEAL